jgi:hypothetical protein
MMSLEQRGLQSAAKVVFAWYNIYGCQDGYLTTERNELWILKGRCIALVDVLAGIRCFSSGAVDYFFFFVAWGGCFLEGSLTKAWLRVQAQHQVLLGLQCTADVCWVLVLILQL